MKEFNKMTVPQLRSALKERDLAQSGLKAELVSRLLSHSLQPRCVAGEVLDEGGATADEANIIHDFTTSTTTDDPWTSISLTNVQLDILKNYKIFVTQEERFCLTKLIQRTPEWFAARKKRITASIFRHLFVDVPDPSNHFLKDHINDISSSVLLCKYMLGVDESLLEVTPAMQAGVVQEELALCHYNFIKNCAPGELIKSGFWVHEKYFFLGASPDALYSSDSGSTISGAVEFKVVSALPETIPKAYELQAIVQLACLPKTVNWVDVHFIKRQAVNYIEDLNTIPSITFRVNRTRAVGANFRGRLLTAINWYFSEFIPRIITSSKDSIIDELGSSEINSKHDIVPRSSSGGLDDSEIPSPTWLTSALLKGDIRLHSFVYRRKTKSFGRVVTISGSHALVQWFSDRMIPSDIFLVSEGGAINTTSTNSRNKKTDLESLMLVAMDISGFQSDTLSRLQTFSVDCNVIVIVGLYSGRRGKVINCGGVDGLVCINLNEKIITTSSAGVERTQKKVSLFWQHIIRTDVHSLDSPVSPSSPLNKPPRPFTCIPTNELIAWKREYESNNNIDLVFSRKSDPQNFEKECTSPATTAADACANDNTPPLTRLDTIGQKASSLYTLHCSRYSTKEYIQQVAVNAPRQPSRLGLKNIDCRFYIQIAIYGPWAVISDFGEHNHAFDESHFHHLKLDERVSLRIRELLEEGHRPAKVLELLDRENNKGSVLLTDRRLSPDMRHINNALAQIRQCSALHPNDVIACDMMTTSLKELNCIAEYTKLTPESEGIPGQPFFIAIMTPWQTEIFRRYGKNISFLDATGSILRLGYQLYALVVQDDTAQGIPVAFMIAPEDNAETVQRFLAAIKQKAGMMSENVMIDKSALEMAALSSEGINFLLCYFHLLQAWERELRSASNGISKEEQSFIKESLKKMVKAETESIFQVKEGEFISMLEKYPDVKKYYMTNWKSFEKHWAFYARQSVSWLGSNTNNFVEAFFKQFKYLDLDKKVMVRLSWLLEIIVGRCIPRYMRKWMREKFSRGIGNRREMRLQRQEYRAMTLQHEFQCYDVANGFGSCVSFVEKSSQIYYSACIGDLSCMCPGANEHICHHLLAGMKTWPLTSKMIKNASKEILKLESTNVFVLSNGLFRVKGLASETWVDVDLKEEYCSCPFTFGTCAHLLACAHHSKLPESIKDGLPRTYFENYNNDDEEEEYSIIPSHCYPSTTSSDSVLSDSDEDSLLLSATKELIELDEIVATLLLSKDANSTVTPCSEYTDPGLINKVHSQLQQIRRITTNSSSTEQMKISDGLQSLIDGAQLLIFKRKGHTQGIVPPHNKFWNRQANDNKIKPLFPQKKQSGRPKVRHIPGQHPLNRSGEGVAPLFKLRRKRTTEEAGLNLPLKPKRIMRVGNSAYVPRVVVTVSPAREGEFTARSTT